jgi:hypothetical protein
VIVKERIHASEVDEGLAEPDAIVRHMVSSASLTGRPANWISWPAPSKTPSGVLPTELVRAFSSGLRPSSRSCRAIRFLEAQFHRKFSTSIKSLPMIRAME